MGRTAVGCRAQEKLDFHRRKFEGVQTMGTTTLGFAFPTSLRHFLVTVDPSKSITAGSDKRDQWSLK